MQMEINVGHDKGHLPLISHEAEQVPGQDGVRWAEERTLASSIPSFYCPSLFAKPSFSISQRGLSNPEHLSHFTTLMVESWL